MNNQDYIEDREVEYQEKRELELEARKETEIETLLNDAKENLDASHTLAVDNIELPTVYALQSIACSLNAIAITLHKEQGS